MCLSFDVPRENLRPVAYVAKRLPLRLPLTPAATEELRNIETGSMKRNGAVGRLEEHDPITGFSANSTIKSGCER
jgi:hypothetical protein